MPAMTPRCLRRFSAAALLTAAVPFALSASGTAAVSNTAAEKRRRQRGVTAGMRELQD